MAQEGYRRRPMGMKLTAAAPSTPARATGAAAVSYGAAMVVAALDELMLQRPGVSSRGLRTAGEPRLRDQVGTHLAQIAIKSTVHPGSWPINEAAW